jgi:hypothetical protein
MAAIEQTGRAVLRTFTVCMAAGALFMSLCLTALMRQTGSVSEQARTAALTALDRYLQTHPGAEPSVLAIADYTKPSCLKRLAIIDLRSGAVSCIFSPMENRAEPSMPAVSPTLQDQA